MLNSDKTIDGILISSLKHASEKKVEVKCDTCGKITIAIYHNYTLGQKRRNYSGETQCRKCAIIKNGRKNLGKPSWNKGKKIKPEERIGKPFISTDGYKMIFEFVENAKSKWEHYRKEHIVLIEKIIGRKLNNDEEVHHLNGDKLDNKIENLLLCTSGEHKLLHFSLQKIAYQLFKNGLINFDIDNRCYKIKEI